MVRSLALVAVIFAISTAAECLNVAADGVSAFVYEINIFRLPFRIEGVQPGVVLSAVDVVRQQQVDNHRVEIRSRPASSPEFHAFLQHIDQHISGPRKISSWSGSYGFLKYENPDRNRKYTWDEGLLKIPVWRETRTIELSEGSSEGRRTFVEEKPRAFPLMFFLNPTEEEAKAYFQEGSKQTQTNEVRTILPFGGRPPMLEQPWRVFEREESILSALSMTMADFNRVDERTGDTEEVLLTRVAKDMTLPASIEQTITNIFFTLAASYPPNTRKKLEQIRVIFVKREIEEGWERKGRRSPFSFKISGNVIEVSPYLIRTAFLQTFREKGIPREYSNVERTLDEVRQTRDNFASFLVDRNVKADFRMHPPSSQWLEDFCERFNELIRFPMAHEIAHAVLGKRFFYPDEQAADKEAIRVLKQLNYKQSAGLMETFVENLPKEQCIQLWGLNDSEYKELKERVGRIKNLK